MCLNILAHISEVSVLARLMTGWSSLGGGSCSRVMELRKQRVKGGTRVTTSPRSSPLPGHCRPQGPPFPTKPHFLTPCLAIAPPWFNHPSKACLLACEALAGHPDTNPKRDPVSRQSCWINEASYEFWGDSSVLSILTWLFKLTSFSLSVCLCASIKGTDPWV